MNAKVTIEKYTLFVDAQNIYNSARQAFFTPEDSGVYGQIDFIKLAKLIESRCPYPDIKRQLHEVRVYTGIPSSRREPRAHKAYMNQSLAWRKAGLKVIDRPLRYLSTWPDTKPQQKGVDVEIAIDFIISAIDHIHNVGILASADTDLIPALNLVKSRCGRDCKIEVVGIDGENNYKRIIKLPDVHCYWLNKDDYDSVSDLTSYSKQEFHSQLDLGIDRNK